jgi:hypothetical protein
MPRVFLDKWDDVAFGIRISRRLILIEFWKWSLMIDFKEQGG